MKCANGKWKYGEHGNCQFDTLVACKKAAAAIHIQEGKADDTTIVTKTKVLGSSDSDAIKQKVKNGL
jgi:hypothetical protein